MDDIISVNALRDKNDASSNLIYADNPPIKGIRAQDGTAASPSFSFSNDTHTGMFLEEANKLALATDSAPRLTIDSHGDVDVLNDLRVASTVNVGNTGFAGPMIHVRDDRSNLSLASTVDEYPLLVSSKATGGQATGMAFYNALGPNPTHTPSASIMFTRDEAVGSTTGGDLSFNVANSDSLTGELTHAMTIDRFGNVDIGMGSNIDPSSNAKLSVEGGITAAGGLAIGGPSAYNDAFGDLRRQLSITSADGDIVLMNKNFNSFIDLTPAYFQSNDITGGFMGRFIANNNGVEIIGRYKDLTINNTASNIVLVTPNDIVTDSRYFGIGASAPVYRLDIGANTAADEVVRVRSQGRAGIRLESDTTNGAGEPGGAYVFFSQDVTSQQGYIGLTQLPGEDPLGGTVTNALSDALILGTRTNIQPIQFAPAGNARMTLSTDGNVGIGTSTPTSELHVIGAMMIEDNYGINMVPDDATLGSSTLQMHIGGNANGGSTYFTAYKYGHGGNRFLPSEPSNVPLMYIQANPLVLNHSGGAGNVGIGKNNPAYKLDVAGSANVTGALLANEVLATSAVYCGTSGSGMVAMTVNDSAGNANITFNNANNAKDFATGTTGRITVNVDATSAGAMDIQVGDGADAGPTSVLNLTKVTSEFTSGLVVSGGTGITGNGSGLTNVTAAGFPTAWMNSSDGNQRLLCANNSHTYIKSPTNIYLRTADAANTKYVTDDGIFSPRFQVNPARGIRDITGKYGTVQTIGTGGGWGGYSINGEYVFMATGTTCGIYNDINDEWMIQCQQNAGVALYYNNLARLQTTSAGVTVTGVLSGNGSGLTSLNGANITNNTIAAAKITANSLTAGQIAANSIGASELANNAVDTAAIANNAVTNVKISAVDASKITTGTINAARLPAAFASGNFTGIVTVSGDGSVSGASATVAEIQKATIGATTLSGNILTTNVTGTFQVYEGPAGIWRPQTQFVTIFEVTCPSANRITRIDKLSGNANFTDVYIGNTLVGSGDLPKAYTNTTTATVFRIIIRNVISTGIATLTGNLKLTFLNNLTTSPNPQSVGSVKADRFYPDSTTNYMGRYVDNIGFFNSSTNDLNAYIENNAQVGQLDFTGQHRVTGDITGQGEGLIVVSTGTYVNVDSSNSPTINEALPHCSLSTTRNDARVFGVISSHEDPNSGLREYRQGAFVTVINKENDSDRLIVNSVGEGSMWVCNINGDLKNGDYITSCEIPGYGMKQSDDLMHNYTVAKITCDCTFSNLDSWMTTKDIIHDGVEYIAVFVGCTYHCG